MKTTVNGCFQLPFHPTLVSQRYLIGKLKEWKLEHYDVPLITLTILYTKKQFPNCYIYKDEGEENFSGNHLLTMSPRNW